MARVFIDTSDIEIAVPAREAALSEGHEIEMVDGVRDLEARAGAEVEALLLTSGLQLDDGPRVSAPGSALKSAFDARIPRPPVLGFAAGSSDRRGKLALVLDLDEVLDVPVDKDDVLVVLERELERYEIQRTTGIVGRTDEIRLVLGRLSQIAPVNSTVLLTGESGTGKELFARAIHRLSPRRGKPFIAVNCAAMPESLLESELFGHEKGAFTGATSLRRGMFELADGGTLLLDEIGEMPPATQTRLLRVLETRRFMRVGGDRELSVNVRVIAATNRDLREAVERGEFRRDLFYRLNVLQLELPTLRDRRADIPILVRRFVDEFSRAHDRGFRGLAPEAMEILENYAWPGNVRELRNLVESMVVLAPGAVIRPEDIPGEIRSGRAESLLPVGAGGIAPSTPSTAAGDAISAPQLEFIFRTLVDLKVDVEDLKSDFERYKRERADLLPGGVEWQDVVDLEDDEFDGRAALDVEPIREHAEGMEPDDTGELSFEPGMSMAELERAAIIATLRQVGGNRRQAAEQLQIGERTLYRKLKQYDIEL